MSKSSVPGRSCARSVMRPPKMIRRLAPSLLSCQGENHCLRPRRGENDEKPSEGTPESCAERLCRFRNSEKSVRVAAPAAVATPGDKQDEKQSRTGDEPDEMRRSPERGADDEAQALRVRDGRGRDDDRLRPIHSHETRKKSLADAALEIVDANVTGVVAGDDQVAGELIPVERAVGGSGCCIAVGDTDRNALLVAAERPDH